MKSKSLNLGHTSAVTLKQNRTFDFVNLYKSAAETSSSFSDKHKSRDSNDTESHTVTSECPKRERSPSKRKKQKRQSVDISQITINGPELNDSIGGSALLNESKVTSTPLGKRKHHDKASKVKSIMKNSSAFADDADSSILDTSTTKSKKRNKSVSFMLEDNEEVVIKKTKSDDSASENRSDSPSSKHKVTKLKKQFKKGKKEGLAEKENKVDVNQTNNMDISVKEKAYTKSKTKSETPNTLNTTPTVESQSSQNDNVSEIKKKQKKVRKGKKPGDTDSKESTATGSTSQELPEKTKKPKKKKCQEKPLSEPDNEEPASKTRKKDSKPDVIAELENLSIGDNAHTLTNLLDEMTVVDKEKRKKLKQKLNKNKKMKSAASTEDSEKTEDGEEKVKWRRRKWNKDTKAEVKEGSLDTAIIVENLPLALLFSYKKILAEHFAKYGLIKSIGIAEVYPTEVLKPVFTTTVNFYSDGAATEALKEDETMFEGSCIRVKRPLPPTQTTLVIRSYGLLTVQSISSTFNSAGRIRNIRHLVKGKHAMATFFIEFDGPESVERAMKLATNIKIGGKKIYVSKFEVRIKKTKQEKNNTNEGSDADQSEDSQD